MLFSQFQSVQTLMSKYETMDADGNVTVNDKKVKYVANKRT